MKIGVYCTVANVVAATLSDSYVPWFHPVPAVPLCLCVSHAAKDPREVALHVRSLVSGLSYRVVLLSFALLLFHSVGALCVCCRESVV